MSGTYNNNTTTWCDLHALPRDECGCPPPNPGEQHRGQARIAYRLAQHYTGQLMHVHGIGWHTWDGTRWIEDHQGAAKRAVLDTLRQALAESLDDKDLRSDVRKCESASGINGVLDIAAALNPFAHTVNDLDTDPYLLNVANGTLDLRTLELRPHNPADRITKVTTAAYNPDARSEEWETFLARVLPDPAVRAFLQRLIGLALLGKVREHIFAIATGTGANGKGTAYGAILHTLGDYGHEAESDLFMASKSNPNAASPAQFRLRGRRLIVASETERNQPLATALMKNLTGGDPITARPLYGSPVTFEPSHTTLMVTNHLPRVAGDDPAAWRRITVIPFDVKLPEPEWDRELPDRLKLVADAILTWAVTGWQDYHENGMNPPPAVLKATDDYQMTSDDVRRFIDSECIINPHMWVTTADAFERWQAWAAQDGAEVLSRKAFGQALDRLGYPADPSRRRHRFGLGLAATETEDED